MSETPPSESSTASSIRRRRRRVEVAGSGPEDPARAARISTMAFGGVGLLAVWGMMAPGAPLAVLHGVVWSGLGLLWLLFPPRLRVGWIGILAGGAVRGGAAMSFLPADWFGKPSWRVALEGLGVATGNLVTMQPGQTMEFWLGLVLSVGAGWFLLGHRVGEGAQRRLAMGLALGIAGYAVVSMLAKGSVPAWSWDPDPSFGLFGNRNHTATLLVMGVLLSMGLLMDAVLSKQGGRSGLASLTLVISLWAVLGYCESRAGLLLVGAGAVAWLVGLGAAGGRYFSRRVMVTVLGFALVTGTVFWWADTGLRERLGSMWERMEEPAPVLAAEDGAGEIRAQPLDFRLVIWQDTWRMLGGEPLTGVGLGQFPMVFPQYREQAAIHAKCWHPESNWLQLAVEAGWLTALALAGAVGGLFFAAFRSARMQRGWPFQWGALLAALVVPVHGIFDVPGHHLGIAWPALILLTLSLRRPAGSAAEAGPLLQNLWRAAGAVVLAAGLWIFTQARPGHHVPAILAPKAAMAEAGERYARDAAEKADPAAHPPERKPDGTPADQLEIAQGIIKEALRRTPLEAELHYWRGLLSVNFSDEEAMADQAFAAQRLLEPDWVNVPWRQGLAWLAIDPARSIALWQEALRRAEAAHPSHPGIYWSPAQLLDQIKSQARDRPEVLQKFFP